MKHQKKLILPIIMLLYFSIPFTSSSRASEINNYQISLESRIINPELLSFSKIESQCSILNNRHVLIQLDDIPSSIEKRQLRQLGINLLGYIPNYAWFAKLTNPQITVFDNIRYISEIAVTDKISSNLLNNGVSENGCISDDIIKVFTVFFDDVSDNQIEVFIESYGSGERVFNDIWEITLHKDMLTKLADEDIVHWVENVSPDKITHVDSIRSAISANEVQESPYNLHANGYTVAMWDGGTAGPHLDYEDRITRQNGISYHYHATNVLGIMAANGSRSEDCGGTPYQWRGVATQANIVSYFWDYYVIEHDQAINTYGADVSQNSWGWAICFSSQCDRFGEYGGPSRSFDEVVRGLYGDKITIVGSAGNDGSCVRCADELPNFPYGTVAGPIATAKNTLSVSGTYAESNEFWNGSSRGPTLDGRIKPDISSPACKSTDYIKTTSSNDCYSYTYGCGTSYAAPAVSGASLLVYEAYNNFFGQDPLPSTVRGILCHTTDDFNNQGPDYLYGYGRLNVRNAIDLIYDDNGTNTRIIENQIDHAYY